MTFFKYIPKFLLFSVLVAGPLFISCKDNASPVEQSSEKVEEATLEQKKQMLDNVVPTNNSNSNSGNTAGLNPEHGQPGHRCEIPVGAPLNGNAGTPAATPIQANAAPAGGNGLNPAHGQPGHRCDIKVGDPL